MAYIFLLCLFSFLHDFPCTDIFPFARFSCTHSLSHGRTHMSSFLTLLYVYIPVLSVPRSSSFSFLMCHHPVSFALYVYMPSVHLTCPFTFSHMQASFPIFVTLSLSIILYVSLSGSFTLPSVSLCILFIPCLFSCLSIFPVSHMHFSLSFCFDCLAPSFLCSLTYHPFYTLSLSQALSAYCFYPHVCTFLLAFLLSLACAVVTSLSCLLAF